MGIGTTAPEERLHLRDGKFKITSAAPIVNLFESDVNKAWFITANNSKFYISHDNTNHNDFVVNKNGNIGMGTWVDNDQGFKLSVAGNIRAHEIKVYNTWADYVFNDDYELMSLTDVERYINKNKHLPGIPSAEEIEENEGINLGEMQKLQMAKIEELTLHLIDQQKQLDKQATLLEKQEALIQQLLIK